MTQIPVDQLKPCRKLACRVYDPQGGLLFERGTPLLPTHLDMLRQCAIDTVVMHDRPGADEQALDGLQREEFDLDHLRPGTVLPGDLFDDEGYRLVPAGATITPDVIRRLKRLGVEACRLLKPRDHRAQSQLLQFRSMANPRPAPRNNLELELGRSSGRIRPATRVDLMINRFEPKLRKISMQVAPEGTPAIDLFDRSNRRTLRPLARKRRMLETFMQLDTHIRRFMKRLRQNPAQDAQRLIKLLRSTLKVLAEDPELMLALLGRKNSTIEYLPRHGLCVAVYAMALASGLGYGVAQVLEVGLGGLLHDLGMLEVSRKLLGKPGRLRPDEISDIRKHPSLGLDVLKRFKGVPESVPYTTYHSHERCDASGYPARRPQQKIHTFAQIVAVADVYDAMVTDRPFRTAFAPHLAMVELLRQASSGKLATEPVQAMVDIVGLYPVGSVVALSDGSVARVIASGGKHHRRPVVNVLVDPGGHRTDGRQIIDLKHDDQLTITREMTGETEHMDVFVGF